MSGGESQRKWKLFDISLLDIYSCLFHSKEAALTGTVTQAVSHMAKKQGVKNETYQTYLWKSGATRLISRFPNNEECPLWPLFLWSCHWRPGAILSGQNTSQDRRGRGRERKKELSLFLFLCVHLKTADNYASLQQHQLKISTLEVYLMSLLRETSCCTRVHWPLIILHHSCMSNETRIHSFLYMFACEHPLDIIRNYFIKSQKVIL